MVFILHRKYYNKWSAPYGHFFSNILIQSAHLRGIKPFIYMLFKLQYGMKSLIMANSLNWTWPIIFFFFFVTYTIIQSITSSEMCSLHLTHPSAHTLGAVGSRCCGTRGAVGGSVPCSRVSPQSWTIPARAEIRTHNLRLQVQRSIH